MEVSFLNNNQKQVPQVGSHVSIRYCVMNAMVRTKDHSMNEYYELLQYAIDIVRDLRIYEQASVEVAYLKPDPDTGVIEWPSDMQDYIKIGVPINGQLYNLTVNENMLLNRAQKCGYDVRKMQKGYPYPPLNGGYFYVPNFYNGQYVPALYGMGGGFNNAYYRVDPTQRRIQLDGVLINNEVVLEYKSTGIKAGTIISAETIPVVRTYILWQRDEYDPRIPLSMKSRRKDQYDEEVAKLHFYTNVNSLQEYLDMFYATENQGLKR